MNLGSSTDAMKLLAYEKYTALSVKNGPIGITRGLATFIGIADLAASLGIVLPMATNSAPDSRPLRCRGARRCRYGFCPDHGEL